MKITREMTLPEWNGESPVNYTDIRDTLALTLVNEDVPKEKIEQTLLTIDDAIINNEHKFVWEENRRENE